MKFLALFAHHMIDFRIPEIESLLELQGLTPESVYDREKAKANIEDPFMEMDFPTEQHAIDFASRSVSLKGMFDVWGEGTSMESMLSSAQQCPIEKMEPYIGEDVTFSIRIDAFGRIVSVEEQLDLIEKFSFLPLRGRVKLKDPSLKLFVLIDIGLSSDPSESPFSSGRRWYFARGMSEGMRQLVGKLSLKRRQYIGPTSTESELSILMANQCLAQPGSIIYDPFVGTGSLLIPCAFLGAFTVGSDIDIRVIRGKSGRTITTNFRQYGLPLPEILRMDNSMPCTRQQPFYNAIVCDPPYGVRAGARKSGSRRKVVKPVPRERKHDHIPQTQPYETIDVMVDLLDRAARNLIIGGRLVYLLPVFVEEYREEHVLVHPCLELVANSEQGLTSRLSRRLITMKKIQEWTVEISRAFREECATLDANQLSFVNIAEKIQFRQNEETNQEQETKTN